MYEVRTTATFARAVKQHQRNASLLRQLDKKITRLQQAPEQVGGALSGALHGYRSTRLAKHFRLLFSVDSSTVTLESLDHRKDAYR